jgi:signal transduction histidine kinase
LLLEGNPLVSTLATAASLVIPAAGLGFAMTALPGRARGAAIAGLTVATAALLIVWGTARLTAVGDPDRLEMFRSSVAFWMTVGLVGLAVLDVRGLTTLRRPSRRTTPELALLAAVIGGFAVLRSYAHVDPVVLVVLAVVLVLAYPRSRRAVLHAADSLFLGGVRRQAAIQASEGERARLAADLHDVPIQELSAVIARLELLPEVAGEREALRRIAGELRSLTSELRPPVLDDLGLPMAIESLADQYARDGTALRVEVADRTRPDVARDPMVELAIYRVTEEAVRNAMIHADAQRVDVTGVIANDRVEIEVRDDGRGLDGRALERARRAGHAGLIAMRHRAEAIGAHLSLQSELGVGVSVLLAWQR